MAKKKQETNPDLARPEGLSRKGALAHRVIREFLANEKLEFTGGCRAFYSPDEWVARGENYCRNALLVIVYDGGALGNAFEYAHEAYQCIERMRLALAEHGLYTECGTHWYSGVYPIEKARKLKPAKVDETAHFRCEL